MAPTIEALCINCGLHKPHPFDRCRTCDYLPHTKVQLEKSMQQSTLHTMTLEEAKKNYSPIKGDIVIDDPALLKLLCQHTTPEPPAPPSGQTTPVRILNVVYGTLDAYLLVGRDIPSRLHDAAMQLYGTLHLVVHYHNGEEIWSAVSPKQWRLMAERLQTNEIRPRSIEEIKRSLSAEIERRAQASKPPSWLEENWPVVLPVVLIALGIAFAIFYGGDSIP